MTSKNKAVQLAMQRLAAGNARFTGGVRSIEHLASALRIGELADKGQKPYAGLLGCADSRVPAEIVFDSGFGELFVCRVAGNVATSEMVGSLEYAVSALGLPLIVVLGHTSCGAVNAALEDGPAELTPALKRLISCLHEPVETAKAALPDPKSPKLWKRAVWENVKHQRLELRKASALLREREAKGTLGIACAVYDLRTGVVEYELVDEPAVTQLDAARA